MKNPAPYVRAALVSLLNGTITYESATVPCYADEAEGVPNQILLTEQTASRQAVKSAFGHEFEQVLEVISERKTNTSKHVDAIGESVMNIIKATPNTTALSGNATWQVGTVKGPSINYLTETTGTGFIKRLILRYQFTIIEK